MPPYLPGKGGLQLAVDVTDDGDLYIHGINVQSEDVERATRLIAQPFE